MLSSSRRRVFALLAALVLLITAAPATAEPGVPPDIVAIIGADTDIDPGETRSLIAEVVGFDEGGTFSFSGSDVTVTDYRAKNGRYRLTVTADAGAAAGPRDLIATNPDGLTGTYVGALTVTGDIPPPDSGDLTGHVFEDLDGNGIEDGADTGLVGVAVSVVDSAGVTHNISTDSSGDFSLLSLPVGDATATYSTPAGMALTTGNSVQVVTIVVDTAVAAADVGYQDTPNGDLTGYVFLDLNANGVPDGAEGGISGVAVSVTDAAGSSFNASTDATGNYTVTGLAVGDSTVTYTAPVDHVLTTGNDVQTVAISDGATANAADVGYDPPAGGDISGHVFSDVDGNGVEDGSDIGLAGVEVTITDAEGGVQVTTTDGAGDFFVAGIAPGNADVVWTTPDNYTLTTGNDTQTIEVFDRLVSNAADVGYQPPSGELPEIVAVLGNNEIDPGETRNIRVSVVNYVAGGTFTFSGTGVTAVVIGERSGTVRMSVTADTGAAGGPRDMTLTNPDGLSDTLVAAMVVTGDAPPPENGDVTGHVFADLDGNGIEDGSDVGLSGVTVDFLDAAGDNWQAVTDGNGDFTITAGVGDGTLTATTPAGYSLTTGNDVQALTVTDGGSTAAAPIGYEPGATTFMDVGGAAGIVQSHTAGAFCGPPIGVGSAWADVDNDGDLDLFTTDFAGSGNHLYINEGDTNGDGIIDFTDMAAALGIDAVSLDSWATVFADVDNDGDADLYVADSSGGTLWENLTVDTGSLSFQVAAGSADLLDLGRVETATFGDFDNDGWLDLYLAKHMHCEGTTQDRLFHNDGDGTFTDWTTYLCDGGDPATCDDVNGLGFAAGMFDYDQDGDSDIYLVNDNIGNVNQPNKMFRNDGSDGAGGWVFTEVGSATGTDLSVNGMGLGLGDYNNDGWTDIAFSNVGPAKLLMNDGDGTFSDVSDASGVTGEYAPTDISWGTAFLDYNNNGWEDLFIAMGYIGDELPMPNTLLENSGGTFTNVAALTGMDGTDRGRNVSIADFNEDGWVDVFVGNFNAAPNLMRNESASLGNTNGWLTVTVEGTESNRDGIGTEMTLVTSTGTQRRVITSGSNHGGGSQQAAFFGLGGDATGSLTVYWPNGQVQVVGTVSANQAIHLVEPETPGATEGLFSNVAVAAGISHTHTTAAACAPAIGVGAAWADVDNDGDQDLYTTDRDGSNHLYRNEGDTSGDGIVDFSDVASALGIDHSGEDSFATVFVDYDNDGDSDLFVANASGNTLWENQLIETGGVSFVDVTATAGLSDSGRIQTATWGDVDNDGNLDVYYAKHMTCVGDGTDRLFRNNGDGTFTDWTTYLCSGGDPATCDDVNGLGFAAGMLDYDGDGDTDIYLVNDNIAGNFQPNKLFRNDGSDGGSGWVFTEVGAAAGADASVNGMGLGIGDYNNDGWLDLAFSDAGPAHLLLNDGDGTFTDVSDSSGVTAGTADGVSWGSAFLDYDNDGWQDLFYVQGSIAIDSPIANALLRNQGDGSFVNVSNETGMGDTQRGRNVSLADFNNDGWVDAFVGNYDGTPLLMRNESVSIGNTNEWLTITVEGTESNRDAIGAVISVTTGAGTQTQLITSGGQHGGGSQKAAFFGLGTATSATVTVTWPNGVVEDLGSLTSGQAVHLIEPAA